MDSFGTNIIYSKNMRLQDAVLTYKNSPQGRRSRMSGFVVAIGTIFSLASSIGSETVETGGTLEVLAGGSVSRVAGAGRSRHPTESRWRWTHGYARLMPSPLRVAAAVVMRFADAGGRPWSWPEPVIMRSDRTGAAACRDAVP